MILYVQCGFSFCSKPLYCSLYTFLCRLSHVLQPFFMKIPQKHYIFTFLSSTSTVQNDHKIFTIYSCFMIGSWISSSDLPAWLSAPQSIFELQSSSLLSPPFPLTQSNNPSVSWNKVSMRRRRRLSCHSHPELHMYEASMRFKLSTLFQNSAPTHIPER